MRSESIISRGSKKSYAFMCCLSITALFLVYSNQMFSQDTLTLAFGSCNKADKNQMYWDTILSDQPDYWIWLGDIVYADTENKKQLKKSYSAQKKNKHYQNFAANCQVMGIWDDHDYGVNDGGSDYPIKKEAKDILFDFLDVPKSSVDRQHTGAYQSYSLKKGDLTVKVVLLDVRYFRDNLLPDKNSKQRYLKDSSANILGEEQWNWLEAQIKSANEDLIIIGSGTQIIPEEHYFEKWANYPGERMRLFKLLEDNDSKNFVLLSGDRHFAEVSAIVAGQNFIYELTSSGLTHSYSELKNEPNIYRIRNFYAKKNYGLLQIAKNNSQLSVKGSIKSTQGEVHDTYEIIAP